MDECHEIILSKSKYTQNYTLYDSIDMNFKNRHDEYMVIKFRIMITFEGILA